MNFLCACITQNFNQTGAGSTTDDRVIYQNNTLALQIVAQRIQLDTYRAFPLILSRLNKGSAYIFILYKA